MSEINPYLLKTCLQLSIVIDTIIQTRVPKNEL